MELPFNERSRLAEIELRAAADAERRRKILDAAREIAGLPESLASHCCAAGISAEAAAEAFAQWQASGFVAIGGFAWGEPTESTA